MSEAIPILYAKIQTYDLDYCDKSGQCKPVKFVSYIWKRIDGHILDGVKRELEHEKELRAELVTIGEWPSREGSDDGIRLAQNYCYQQHRADRLSHECAN